MLKFNFTPFPVLTTQRLVLRELTMKDNNEIFSLRSDDRVNEFLDRPKTNSLEEAENFINKIHKGIIENELIYWAITLKNDDKLIGCVCYGNISKENDKAEIGYELHPDFQSKGIMQEVIMKIIEFGFDNMKLQTIDACVTFNNIRSIRILEKNNFILDNASNIENDIPANMARYLLMKRR
jgi:[ribosomal protein S5]-alanine N-acetyltransferase